MTTDATRPEASLPLNSVFGPTLQGEGPHTGRRCCFVRLGHCNLACAWCDTADTWDTTRYDVEAANPWTPVDTIAARLADRAPSDGLVILSGGEPLLHQRRPAFTTLLEAIRQPGRTVHAETNGTIRPAPAALATITHFTVSPKLANNHADPESRRTKPAALHTLAELAADTRACFKFVAATPGDLDEIDALVATYDIAPDDVWIMPEGTTPTEVLETHRALADPALERGYNTTTRLHTLLWGNERDR